MWVRMHPQRAPVLEEGGRAELRQKMKVAFCRSFGTARVSPPAAPRSRGGGLRSVAAIPPAVGLQIAMPHHATSTSLQISF